MKEHVKLVQLKNSKLNYRMVVSWLLFRNKTTNSKLETTFGSLKAVTAHFASDNNPKPPDVSKVGESIVSKIPACLPVFDALLIHKPDGTRRTEFAIDLWIPTFETLLAEIYIVLLAFIRGVDFGMAGTFSHRRPLSNLQFKNKTIKFKPARPLQTAGLKTHRKEHH